MADALHIGAANNSKLRANDHREEDTMNRAQHSTAAQQTYDVHALALANACISFVLYIYQGIQYSNAGVTTSP